MKTFRLTVRAGTFKNLDVTEEDINLAEKIYGPCGSVMKGKMKRPTPGAVVELVIAIPHAITDHKSIVNVGPKIEIEQVLPVYML